MSQRDAKRIGICWADPEYLWWNADSEATCPQCVRSDEDYAANHSFFVTVADLAAAEEALRRAEDVVEAARTALEYPQATDARQSLEQSVGAYDYMTRLPL